MDNQSFEYRVTKVLGTVVSEYLNLGLLILTGLPFLAISPGLQFSLDGPKYPNLKPDNSCKR